MVNVSTEKTKQLGALSLSLIIIEAIGSITGLITLLYYDYQLQTYTGIFQYPIIRFTIRETLVYINATIGYYTIAHIFKNQPIAKLFFLSTVALDLLFIASGVMRQFGIDNLTMITAYANIYNIIGTGMLFLFFAILALQQTPIKS